MNQSTVFSGLRAWVVLALLLLTTGATQAAQVYNQPHNGSGTIYRSCWADPEGTAYDEFLWDSFQLVTSEALTEVRWRGGHDPAYAYWGQPVIDFRVKIFPNSIANQPDVVAGPLRQYQTGTNCGETLAGTFGGVAMYDYHFTLPAPFQAAASTRYWVQVIANQGGIPDWGFAAATGGNGSHFRHLTEGQYQSISGDAAFSLHTSSAPTATVTASVEPAGTGTVFGAGVYPVGSNCTLTATPSAGYGFTNWTVNGSVVSSNPNYTFAVTADRALVAHFVPACVVTTDRWPVNGGHVSGEGTYNSGSLVTVTATPGLGYLFAGWLEWGSTLVSTSPSYTFTAGSDVLLIAQFEQLPLAATFDFDTGSPPCYIHQTMPDIQSHSGLTAAFSAQMAFWSIQNTFYGWVPLDFAGNFLYPSSSGGSLFIAFSQPLTDLRLDFFTGEISADFDVASLVRITGYQGGSGGTVVGSAAARGAWRSNAYPEGQVSFSSPVPFDAVVVDIPPQQGYPVSGYLFMDNLVAVRAPLAQALVSADAWPAEAGVVLGAGSYDLGSSVSVEAVAATGFVFSHWEDNGVNIGGGPLLELLVDGDHVLTAVFAPLLEIRYQPELDPGVVSLSWPWPCAGFVLREMDMEAGAIWIDSTLPVQVVNGRNVVRAPVQDNGLQTIKFQIEHL